MKRSRLLSAASALAFGALLAAPAHAFDYLNWNWHSENYSGVDAYFNINVDFVPWGLTQTERLQIMVGKMSAMADGSGATVAGGSDGGYVLPPVVINNNQTITQTAENAAEAGSPGYGSPSYLGRRSPLHHGNQPGDVSQSNEQIAEQVNHITIDFGDLPHYYAHAMDAVDDLGKVEISATAASNIASLDGEHVTLIHDGQIAFGDYVVIPGGIYDEVQDRAAMANVALSNWIGWNGGDPYTSDDDTWGTSGNRNFDLAMLGYVSGQHGLIEKGYNSAVALGDYITNAAVEVSATAAANIHSVSLESHLEATPASYGAAYVPTIDTDNVAMVDLTQFAYMDTFAYASAKDQMIGGYKNLGKIDGPILSVSASALGNVSTITNKFGGGSSAAE